MEISIIGDYKILKQLGSSSFSEVFLAEHKFLKKRDAIKVIDESLTQNKNFIKSFEDKVGFLTTIDHPAIVKIHDISNVDGKYFLVMDPIVNDNNEVLNLEKYKAVLI